MKPEYLGSDVLSPLDKIDTRESDFALTDLRLLVVEGVFLLVMACSTLAVSERLSSLFSGNSVELSISVVVREPRRRCIYT
jgi:hypothetical protein